MNNIIEKFKIYGFKRFFSYAAVELKNKIVMQFLNRSYSQKGEDLMIDKLLGYKKMVFMWMLALTIPTGLAILKDFIKRAGEELI